MRPLRGLSLGHARGWADPWPAATPVATHVAVLTPSALLPAAAQVVYKANFEGANLSDVLMDRAVLNEANLRNANLERTVLTRSDLTDADIYGADFSNALIDKAQQIKLCRYADGVNSVTVRTVPRALGRALGMGGCFPLGLQARASGGRAALLLACAPPACSHALACRACLRVPRWAAGACASSGRCVQHARAACHAAATQSRAACFADAMLPYCRHVAHVLPRCAHRLRHQAQMGRRWRRRRRRCSARCSRSTTSKQARGPSNGVGLLQCACGCLPHPGS